MTAQRRDTAWGCETALIVMLDSSVDWAGPFKVTIHHLRELSAIATGSCRLSLSLSLSLSDVPSVDYPQQSKKAPPPQALIESRLKNTPPPHETPCTHSAHSTALTEPLIHKPSQAFGDCWAASSESLFLSPTVSSTRPRFETG